MCDRFVLVGHADHTSVTLRDQFAKPGEDVLYFGETRYDTWPGAAKDIVRLLLTLLNLNVKGAQALEPAMKDRQLLDLHESVLRKAIELLECQPEQVLVKIKELKTKTAPIGSPPFQVNLTGLSEQLGVLSKHLDKVVPTKET